MSSWLVSSLHAHRSTTMFRRSTEGHRPCHVRPQWHHWRSPGPQHSQSVHMVNIGKQFANGIFNTTPMQLRSLQTDSPFFLLWNEHWGIVRIRESWHVLSTQLGFDSCRKSESFNTSKLFGNHGLHNQVFLAILKIIMLFFPLELKSPFCLRSWLGIYHFIALLKWRSFCIAASEESCIWNC